MSEANGGFSFGDRGASNSSQDDEEVDAIEVSGEPITRKEAKNMGLVTLDSKRETRGTTTIMRNNDLPDDFSPEQAKKLDSAWEHLKNNETEKALTLAQEVVFEYPSLVAAKLIIARCFINRKEFEKGLAILQAIPEDEKNPETHYYVGVCQSRLGKVKEAIDALKLCRSLATDNALRKRANDLLLHLQGEQTVCPICGKKTLYDSMVEVDNQNICANCAKNLSHEESGEEDFDEDGEINGGKRRKRLRPPLTKAEILLRLVFFFFLLLIMAFGVYVFSILAPGPYSWFRGFLPAGWTWLPSPVVPVSFQEENVDGKKPGGRTVLPSLLLTSPMLDRAVVGVELRHQLRIDEMHQKGVYHLDIYPNPAGPCKMDADTGLFTWTPAEEDAGKDFEVKFYATFGSIQSRDQINRVTVSPGPKFDKIWEIPEYSLALALALSTAELDGEPGEELLVASGEYWSGTLTALRKSDDKYEPIAQTTLPGRPTGVGVVKVGEDKWVAVADFWSSRIRYYTLRNGSLSELAMTIDLPGRPLMADFDTDNAIMAVLCRTADSLRVVAIKQSTAREFRTIGEWKLPDDFLWKRVFILRNSNPAALLRFLVVGADFPNSSFLLTERLEVPRQEKNLFPGVLVDATTCPERQKIHVLVESQGKMRLAELVPEQSRENMEWPTISAGTPPMLDGFACAHLSNEKSLDLVALSSTQLGISFGNPEGKLSDMAFWRLPEPARLFGTALPVRTNGGEDAIVYFGSDGDLWSVTLPKQ